MKIYFNLFLLTLLFFGSNLYAQKNLPRLSPKSLVGQTVGYTNVEITYGSPGVNERVIWGELVSYNEVWRAGANEATTIEFSNDVIVQGNKVPAGKYSLFTIPTKSSWTVILNKVYEQWGAFKYNVEEDLLRFEVSPVSNTYVERLKYSIEYQEAYISIVNIEWEKLKISFTVKSNLNN